MLILYRVSELSLTRIRSIFPSFSCRYTGTEGIYTHTVAYERDPACLECSPASPLEVSPDATLQQVHPLFHVACKHPCPSQRCLMFT